jgi:hypothetical protein
MSESKHTPGPWAIGPDAVNETRRQEHLIGLPNQPDGLSMTERIANYAANAVLIAAAPDMLAVLVDVDEWLMDDRYNLPDDVVCAINAAIKKARGEK